MAQRSNQRIIISRTTTLIKRHHTKKKVQTTCSLAPNQAPNHHNPSWECNHAFVANSGQHIRTPSTGNRTVVGFPITAPPASFRSRDEFISHYHTNTFEHTLHTHFSRVIHWCKYHYLQHRFSISLEILFFM